MANDKRPEQQYSDVPGHPLQYVPLAILSVAREVLMRATQYKDVDPELGEALADSVVLALAENNFLRLHLNGPVQMPIYPLVEWRPEVFDDGDEITSNGYVVDAASGIEVMPLELAEHYNSLVNEVTTLYAQRSEAIECVKRADVHIKTAEIALGKDLG